MNAISQEQPRVLIVDDQKNWRETLRDTLDPTVYEIRTAASYDEAKRLLQQHAFHVLVADQRLVDGESSNMQGILLLDEVAELRDGTQAIIVTGYPSIEMSREALRGRAAYDYILKCPDKGEPPFNIQYRERVKEAAEKWRMSEAWVRQKIFRKEIRYLKVGRRVFIPEATIREVLEHSVVEPHRSSEFQRPAGNGQGLG